MIEFNQHPIETQEYAIYTPPIEDMFNVVKFWIDNHLPGAFIYGLPRLGKSRALKFWIRHLIDEAYFGRCTCFRVILEDAKYSSMSVYDCFLSSPDMGKDQRIPAGKEAKKKLLIKRLVNLTQCCGSNRLVFLIDEAQNLNETGYNVLIYIQNKLDEIGIRTTTILVGSHYLKGHFDVFSSAFESQITGRFMLTSHRFRGITGRDELNFVLESYDKFSEWPVSSGTSYTQHYFPSAFNNGFRMTDYCDLFIDCFSELVNLDIMDIEIPMQHVAIPIEYILKNLKSDTTKEVRIKKSMAMDAIKLSGFASYLKSIPYVENNRK